MTTQSRVENYLNVESTLVKHLGGFNKNVLVSWDSDEVMYISEVKESDYKSYTLSEISRMTGQPISSLEDHCVIDLFINNNMDLFFDEENLSEYDSFTLSIETGASIFKGKELIQSVSLEQFIAAFDTLPPQEWTFEGCYSALHDPEFD
ncbi:hypothetical protein [Vibrio sp. D431a]|uniref:hypothetical protein n=1 Tax=Vibrio sp. D431a TaxID=2837388 RepID=UPI0025542DF1|nr:hypothetical protein [Vibrio sp. D431a]MDK9790197.1 hypothetical protein [Vibrio sp. D431a]